MLYLEDFDLKVEQNLRKSYQIIAQKSKALSGSLKRCFQKARNSQRFNHAYEAGKARKWQFLEPDQLLRQLTEPFEKEDFMDFREFVRLLRACSLHISGEVSAQIKEKYNQTMKGERVLLAYTQGLNEAPNTPTT